MKSGVRWQQCFLLITTSLFSYMRSTICYTNSISKSIYTRGHNKQAIKSFGHKVPLKTIHKFSQMTHFCTANAEQSENIIEEMVQCGTKNDVTKDTSALTLVNNAKFVARRMNDATIRSGRDPSSVRLVCVSKTKSVECIQTLYDAGFRDFGENYFQEILSKAEVLPQDIKWHFIGNLQSAKASKLVRSVLNLSVVETVDTLKLAKKLDTACESCSRPPLSIYIQVDTSGEDTKSGVDPIDLVSLALSIREECPRLSLSGLMTIGAPDDFTCFDKLVECRVAVAAAIGVDISSLALSMGMSGDYEEAIERGATNVRVGSTIFGARDYGVTNPNDKK